MSIDPDEQFVTALVEEAAKKSSLVWLRPLDRDHPLAVWHEFTDGAVHVVGGGAEQPLPITADGQQLELTVRSKDSGGRLLRLTVTAHRVEPGSEAWDTVVPVLHSSRLNSPDGEQAPARWARESTVWRLEPTGRVHEAPGHLSHSAHLAPPQQSPATTRGRLPFVLGRRARRRR